MEKIDRKILRLLTTPLRKAEVGQLLGGMDDTLLTTKLQSLKNDGHIRLIGGKRWKITFQGKELLSKFTDASKSTSTVRERYERFVSELKLDIEKEELEDRIYETSKLLNEACDHKHKKEGEIEWEWTMENLLGFVLDEGNSARDLDELKSVVEILDELCANMDDYFRADNAKESQRKQLEGKNIKSSGL